MDNKDEMDKFQETYNWPRLNQEETDNLNRQITRSELEFIMNKLPENKSTGLDNLKGKFYQTYKEEIIPLLHKLFQKIKGDGKLTNSFYEATSSLITKPDKDTTKKKITDQYH